MPLFGIGSLRLSGFLFLPLSLALLVIGGCKDGNTDDDDNFDRTAMLSNYADHLIVPAYDLAKTAAENLQNTWMTFIDEPGEPNLLACREAWLQAILAWQEASIYNVGPAAEEGLYMAMVEELSTFPVDTQAIEDFITAGDASLDNFLRDTRGYLALDYLLFGDDLSTLLVDLVSPDRQAYVSAVIAHIVDQLSTVQDGWNGFRNEFTDNDGTDVGSSTSQLYNEFVRSFERAKNLKVGLPAGRQAGQTGPEPTLVEGFYSGHSLAILKAHLAAIERVYFGRDAAGVDGSGFEDYLQAVVGGPDLVTLTEAQWSDVETALAAVPESPALSDLAEQESDELADLHTELQKHTRFFKSDMSSLLGIAITFDSGDGD